MPVWSLPRPLRLSVFGAATAVLLYLSLAPNEDLPGAIMFWDKAEHALAYLVLAGLGLILFPRHRFGVAVYSLAVGVGVEFLQAAMGFGRQGDWRDALAGAIGVAAALGLDLAVRRLRRRP
jgi:VanZ family protein